MHFVCERLFPEKVSTSDEQNVTILHEFSSPFKTYNLHELIRGDEGIKYPIIKRDSFKVTSGPAPISCLQRQSRGLEQILSSIQLHGKSSPIPCLSNNPCSCAVAIVAEVKATASAKNQWSSLAYLQVLERILASREATYIGDENICQYGYGICGLKILVWQMALEWNRSKGQK